jgi:uncharacterized membrane protein
MISTFMRSPLPNTLAVFVLLALLITWFTSVSRALGNRPIDTQKGSFAWFMPLFSILGLPAIVDLLQTQGLTLLYASVAGIVIVLNVVLPLLNIYEKSKHPLVTEWYKWTVLFSCIAGLAVAGYLTFVETSGTEVSCGPSGGCEDVQNSPYATLFGVLPVGILGLMGYIAILACWIALQVGPASIQKPASIAIWGLCIFGTLFSAYLTYLEPFVIGATCMWCITSAVLMIILLLATTPLAQQAFAITEDD